MRTDKEYIPVDYKFGCSHNGGVHLNHKYQLAAYALLVEENFKTIVKRGYIHYSKDKVNMEIDLNDEISRRALKMLREIGRIVEEEIEPTGTRNTGRCTDCEYSNLSADAINMGGMLICDLKTGTKKDFHRLSATGYALVYESLYEVPINIGCTVYLSFPKNHPTPHIDRDFFIINDEVRQWFIEERDGKQDMIFYERDPGKCHNPGSCRYKKYCE